MNLGKFLTSVFLLFTVFSIIAQENQSNDPFYTYENIPSSPEAASLGEFGNITASAYNGKANVAVPIYVINFEGLQLPIQLSYNSGGVRVSEEASWVGLNWSLSSSFGISRKIYGIDDFSKRKAGEYVGAPDNGFIYNDLTVTLNEGASRPYLPLNTVLNVHHSYGIQTVVTAAPRHLDTQPDVFHVSLLGQSYKFIFKKKGSSNVLQTQVFDNNNVIITYNLDNKTFTVKDENGFTYTFGTREVNTTFSTAEQAGGYTDAFYKLFAATNRTNQSLITNWSLDKIVAPSGRTLNFSYTKGLHFSFPSYSFYRKGSDETTRLNWPSEQYTSGGSKEGHSVATTVIENNYLNRIYGDFGEVKFNLGSRNDLCTGSSINVLSQNGFGSWVLITSQSQIRSCHGSGGTCNNSSSYLPKKLNSIYVNDKHGKRVINAQFIHSYFNSHKLNDSKKERYLRLKLDKVKVNDMEYSFAYQNANSLAAKDSDGVDFWGYDNGKDNNDGFVPKIGRFITSRVLMPGNVATLAQSFMKYSGSDRSSNFYYGKDGLLTKMTYPTKGTTSFEYEPHDIVRSSPAPFVVTENISGTNRLRYTNMQDESRFDITYQYLKSSEDPNYNYYEKMPPQVQGDAVTTTIQMNTQFTVEFPSLVEIHGTVDTYTGWSGISFWSSYPILVVEEVNTGQEYTVFTYADGPATMSAPPNNVSKTINIGPGTYKVAARTAPWSSPTDPPIPATVFQSSQMLLHSYESADSDDLADFFERFEIGGARVKRIIHKDENGNFASGIRYEYKYPEGVEGLKSSGLLMDDLIFQQKASGFHSYNPRNYGSFQLIGHNAIGSNPSAQGSHVGYSFVREFKINEQGASEGWIDREFHNQKNEYFQDSFSFPYSYDASVGDGDPYIRVFGIRMKWTCSGLDFGNNCAGNTRIYSPLGDASIQNTTLLGLPLRLSFGYINGKVMKESVYNSSGTKVRETENTYRMLNGNLPLSYYSSFINTSIPIAVVDGQGAVQSNLYNTTQGPWGADHHSYYPYLFPLHHGLIAKLELSKTTDYFDSGTSVTENENTYNEDTHHAVSSTSKINDGETIKTEYKYPYDAEVYNNSYMSNLRNENRLASLIKTKTYKNNTKLTTTQYNYGRNSNTSYKTLVTSVSSAKGTNSLKVDRRFQRYDNKGNLLEKKQENGTPVTYVWGYHQKYVIAKIENATYAQVSSQVSNLQSKSNADNDRTLGTSGKEGALRSALTSLRNSLPNAMVTTYTYDPLIGVTSITDPSGEPVYYHYDSSNRLQYIKNSDGRVLEEYAYNYSDGSPVGPTFSIGYVIDGGSGSVSVSPTTVASGGNATVNLTPASGYTVDYVKVGSTSIPVLNNTAVIQNITANTTVNVKFKTIPIAVTLTVSPTSLSFTAGGGSRTITINSNSSWTITKSASWISTNKTSGIGSSSFSIRAAGNSGSSSRLGWVRVISGSTTRTISISQSGSGGGGGPIEEQPINQQ
ncbi:MAG: hypothetical protein QNJ57_01285 [Flavobacteriaceae bacterium]|nr:hypothetical protein [Flavobacteriaceae bacterium]